MSGSSQMKLTVSTEPCMTLRTPFGRPAWTASSAMIMDAPGSRSEGLTMRVLPVAMACKTFSKAANFCHWAHHGNGPKRDHSLTTRKLSRGRGEEHTGKLKGQMAAPTPSGARRVSVSMSLDTSIFSPSS
jgi:hypothetical protein